MSPKPTTAEYSTTKAECQSKIHGVCNGCGGVLKPMKTVDNSGTPTYWAGCEHCSKFCWGVSPEVFAIADKLVTEENLITYSHMDRPEGRDEAYKEYWLDEQRAGACRTVQDVLRWQQKLHEALSSNNGPELAGGTDAS